MRHYCTYFDRNYLVRGLSLLASLQRHARPFRLWVLCLDDATYEALEHLAGEELARIRLEELEREQPELLQARDDGRSRFEYYFTLTPCLSRSMLDRADSVTYLDADLYLFSSPEEAFQEIGEASVAIVEHRFTARAQEREALHGRFNVGWLTFRDDPQARACLARWREQCLASCSEDAATGHFGDQKYLDDWPERWPGVVVLRHPGLDVGPWNLDARALSRASGGWTTAGRPLICYHFHGIRGLGGRVLDTGLGYYGVPLTSPVRRLYAEYLAEWSRQGAFGVAPARGGGVMPWLRAARDGGLVVRVGGELWPLGLGRLGHLASRDVLRRVIGRSPA